MATGNVHTDQHRRLALVGLVVTGILMGAALGALTNGINGWVSPLYFRNIMRWQEVKDVWRASIAQGIRGRNGRGKPSVAREERCPAFLLSPRTTITTKAAGKSCQSCESKWKGGRSCSTSWEA
jgi:hypothetical protein